jgi:uncharacterized protein
MAALLAPGAGSSSAHPTLLAIAEALAPMALERMDFPYRKAGRRFPDREPVLVDAVVRAAAALADAAGVAPGAIVLGGRSMGGRMCSLAVARGLAARALVLVGYPLHPPTRPDRRRDGHFGELGVPCLFVSGTRDAFATPAELEEATAAVAGPVTHAWIEGGRHELAGVGQDRAVAAIVAEWVAGLGAGPPPR